MEIYLYLIPFICLGLSLLLISCDISSLVLFLVICGVLSISLLSQIISGFASDYGIMKSSAIPFYCFVVNVFIDIVYYIYSFFLRKKEI